MTVERRPTAYKLGGEVEATIIDSSGDALVIYYYHGLSDGDVVYIKSDAESYNGFKFVDVIDNASFKIRDTENGSNISFYKEITIAYFPSTLTHGWVAVHQPIVYQISNDKYPTNESYVTATITSVTNNNGYMRIVCSGNIDSALVDLDYVKITNLGAYQVKDAETNSICTLDLAYDSSVASQIVGETVSFYYNNYHMLVRVYGGLNSSHPYATEKPYELLATLKLIPDSNNLVTFDISEILKAKVPGDNNLLLDTLPLNLDAFCQFYISYSEAYDESDGTTISTFTDAFTVDSLEGYAIDAVMPFKSRNINTMSDYVASDTDAGSWLTLFARPVYVPGVYFDLSFIKNDEGRFDLNVNGNVIHFEDKGIGVYRVPITEDILYSEDELCVSITRPAQSTPDEGTPTVASLSEFENTETGTSWTTGANPVVVLPGEASAISKHLRGAISGGCDGIDYDIGYDVDFSGHDGVYQSVLRCRLYDSTYTQYTEQSVTFFSDGNKTGTFSFSPSFNPAYLVFIFDKPNIGLTSYTLDINSFTFTPSGACPGMSLAEKELVSELCIDVIDNLCLSVIDAGEANDSDSAGTGDCPPGILNEGEGYILLE